MPPPTLPGRHSSRLFLTLASLASQHVSHHFTGGILHSYAKRAENTKSPEFIVFAVLIPVLVLLSGVFAGLTLGYMSLDETQLHVLSISGTPKQQEYANKIKPIRKNGHLLLVTLLLANMITNETLPVISDPVLGGGVQSVVVSTILIVIFAEIIPQSVCTRHGLYIGAKMAGPTRILIYILGIIAWPVAKFLEFVLGPHHGIIYRRAELKELIAMHSSLSPLGGDLKKDTVTIIGATLDLQEKVVNQAMTPIEDVFMLSIDSKLDLKTLKRICATGHSRVPVYEEVDLPVKSFRAMNGGGVLPGVPGGNGNEEEKFVKVKKVIGILLVKQCVMLDPKDATPLRRIPLNKVPFVPKDEPLLGILDRFQEGRSHMAIVTRLDAGKAASIKKAVRRGLTQRLMQSVGMGDSSDESSDEDGSSGSRDREATLYENGEDGGDKEMKEEGEGDLGKFGKKKRERQREKEREREKEKAKKRKEGKKEGSTSGDLEMGIVDKHKDNDKPNETRSRKSSYVQFPKAMSAGLEQRMPADAVLAVEGAKEFLKGVDPAIMPIGIITLEDVLEELIGEEIYDEFDTEGSSPPAVSSYVPPENPSPIIKRKFSAPEMAGHGLLHPQHDGAASSATPSPFAPAAKSNRLSPVIKPLPLPALPALKSLNFLRTRSAPPTPRDQSRDPHNPPATPLTTIESIEPPSTSGVISSALAATYTSSSNSASIPVMFATDENGEVTGVVHSADEGQSPTPGDAVEPGPGILKLSTPPSGGSTPPGSVSIPSAPPIVRSGSGPIAAPLEAILLDRKRQKMHQGTGAHSGVRGAAQSQPTITSPALSSASLVPGAVTAGGRIGQSISKGSRFKSSPLGSGGSPDVIRAGEIIADAFKRDDELSDRIPQPEKEKDGPDKVESINDGL